ncbi:hypothetical protein ABPG74_016343 [Tetrahymena malaccensis]
MSNKNKAQSKHCMHTIQGDPQYLIPILATEFFKRNLPNNNMEILNKELKFTFQKNDEKARINQFLEKELKYLKQEILSFTLSEELTEQTLDDLINEDQMIQKFSDIKHYPYTNTHLNSRLNEVRLDQNIKDQILSFHNQQLNQFYQTHSNNSVPLFLYYNPSANNDEKQKFRTLVNSYLDQSHSKTIQLKSGSENQVLKGCFTIMNSQINQTHNNSEMSGEKLNNSLSQKQYNHNDFTKYTDNNQDYTTQDGSKSYKDDEKINNEQKAKIIDQTNKQLKQNDSVEQNENGDEQNFSEDDPEGGQLHKPAIKSTVQRNNNYMNKDEQSESENSQLEMKLRKSDQGYQTKIHNLSSDYDQRKNMQKQENKQKQPLYKKNQFKEQSSTTLNTSNEMKNVNIIQQINEEIEVEEYPGKNKNKQNNKIQENNDQLQNNKRNDNYINKGKQNNQTNKEKNYVYERKHKNSSNEIQENNQNNVYKNQYVVYEKKINSNNQNQNKNQDQDNDQSNDFNQAFLQENEQGQEEAQRNEQTQASNQILEEQDNDDQNKRRKYKRKLEHQEACQDQHSQNINENNEKQQYTNSRGVQRENNTEQKLDDQQDLVENQRRKYKKRDNFDQQQQNDQPQQPNQRGNRIKCGNVFKNNQIQNEKYNGGNQQYQTKNQINCERGNRHQQNLQNENQNKNEYQEDEVHNSKKNKIFEKQQEKQSEPNNTNKRGNRETYQSKIQESNQSNQEEQNQQAEEAQTRRKYKKANNDQIQIQPQANTSRGNRGVSKSDQKYQDQSNKNKNEYQYENEGYTKYQQNKFLNVDEDEEKVEDNQVFLDKVDLNRTLAGVNQQRINKIKNNDKYSQVNSETQSNMRNYQNGDQVNTYQTKNKNNQKKDNYNHQNGSSKNYNYNKNYQKYQDNDYNGLQNNRQSSKSYQNKDIQPSKMKLTIKQLLLVLTYYNSNKLSDVSIINFEQENSIIEIEFQDSDNNQLETFKQIKNQYNLFEIENRYFDKLNRFHLSYDLVYEHLVSQIQCYKPRLICTNKVLTKLKDSQNLKQQILKDKLFSSQCKLIGVGERSDLQQIEKDIQMFFNRVIDDFLQPIETLEYSISNNNEEMVYELLDGWNSKNNEYFIGFQNGQQPSKIIFGLYTCIENEQYDKVKQKYVKFLERFFNAYGFIVLDYQYKDIAVIIKKQYISSQGGAKIKINLFDCFESEIPSIKDINSLNDVEKYKFYQKIKLNKIKKDDFEIDNSLVFDKKIILSIKCIKSEVQKTVNEINDFIKKLKKQYMDIQLVIESLKTITPPSDQKQYAMYLKHLQKIYVNDLKRFILYKKMNELAFDTILQSDKEMKLNLYCCEEDNKLVLHQLIDVINKTSQRIKVKQCKFSLKSLLTFLQEKDSQFIPKQNETIDELNNSNSSISKSNPNFVAFLKKYNICIFEQDIDTCYILGLESDCEASYMFLKMHLDPSHFYKKNYCKRFLNDDPIQGKLNFLVAKNIILSSYNNKQLPVQYRTYDIQIFEDTYTFSYCSDHVSEFKKDFKQKLNDELKKIEKHKFQFVLQKQSQYEQLKQEQFRDDIFMRFGVVYFLAERFTQQQENKTVRFQALNKEKLIRCENYIQKYIKQF